MKDVDELIYDYIAEHDGINDAIDSVLRYFDTDTIVKWFVEGYFCNEEDMLDNMGEEGEPIAEHYKKHC